MLAQHIEPFTCNVTPERDHVIVAPRGDLDMATVGLVEGELQRLRDSGFDSIVLDLRGLTFMDSSGLHLITRWANDASQDGFVFELEPGPPVVQRVFELTSMTKLLPFRDQPG